MGEEPTTPTDYLQSIYDEVKENIDYIVDVEGIEIPEVWQQKILAPLAFAIAFWSNEEGKPEGKPNE